MLVWTLSSSSHSSSQSAALLAIARCTLWISIISRSIASLSSLRASATANLSATCANAWVSIPSTSRCSSAITLGTLNTSSVSSSSSPSSVVVCTFLRFSPPLGDTFIAVLSALFLTHLGASFPLPSVLLPVAAPAPPGPRGQTHALHAFWQGRHAHALPFSLTRHPLGSPNWTVHLLHALGVGPATTVKDPAPPAAPTPSALMPHQSPSASRLPPIVALPPLVTPSLPGAPPLLFGPLLPSALLLLFAPVSKPPSAIPPRTRMFAMYLLLPLPLHFCLFFPPLFLARLCLCYLGIVL
ncbi:hypothetical protein SCLCIDRAFT_26808 [Scleroderma citrinum Foug A]|uniref:Uncharacterized protein n=1 Tax=Scleroderma citrinum Foug A TaxID=1036808 RepID=A0A0C3DW98_9AGAM|nr:hypothetical protein SCLCIDRAFT_26808 [Scleroderma citrinum Foug A]